MKRITNLYDQIITYENLLLAAHKAFKGKCTDEVVSFRNNFLENISELRLALLDSSFELGNYKEFVIFEPKRRLICVAPLKQRILHHAIMNVCHERFNQNLIYDSYASRPGKGSHNAILRIKDKCEKYKYFVKLDVRKYFDSINHDKLKTLLLKLFKDKKLLKLLDRIIDSHGIEKGLPIGNLTSQYFANYYLSSVDHYMKEIVKCPIYVRYMDDVIIMSNEKERLKEYIKTYSAFLHTQLYLEIKPPIVGKICNGIPFLGYVVYKDKIFMNGKGKRRYKRTLNKYNKLFEEGKISEQEFSTHILAILSYAKFADSWLFRSKYLG